MVGPTWADQKLSGKLGGPDDQKSTCLDPAATGVYPQVPGATRRDQIPGDSTGAVSHLLPKLDLLNLHVYTLVYT